jgi:hypothetical protein
MHLSMVVRPHRFEMAGAVVATALTFLVGGGLALRLVAFDIPLACFRDGGGVCVNRQLDVQAYLELAGNMGVPALGSILLLPAFLGLLLGIAIVGKEIDQGSVVFAWSVGPSRRRWLSTRAIPVAAAILTIGLAVGALGDWLEALRDPGSDPWRTFGHLGMRGPVLGAAGLAFFGIAMLVGAMVGRVLPALLMALALVMAAGVGVTVLSDTQLQHETVLTYGMDGGVPGRVVDYLIQVPTGEILPMQKAYERYGEQMDQAFQTEGGTTDFRPVLGINPPELYPWAVARLVILYAALGFGAIVGTFAVVERRRP